MLRSFILLAVLGLGGLPQAGHSHEYWIAAQKFQINPGEAIIADLLVGSMMSGEAYPWLKRSAKAAKLWGPDGSAVEITGREGDLPALDVTPLQAGLNRISFHSAPSYVVFEDFAGFQRYLDFEGLAGVAEAHRKRGLPEEDFIEEFTRNARALVQVGPVIDGQTDAPTGMPFELVAEGNPYTPGLTQLALRLTWNGQPAGGVQVGVFRTPPGATPPEGVERGLFTTDDAGRVTVPVGLAGRYMLSAVHIEPLDAGTAAVWRSHWASLTFALMP
jgi:hypothetical protein